MSILRHRRLSSALHPLLIYNVAAAASWLLQEMASMLEYLSVSKRICLYLARISPQQTIDHLVYEISLQLHEIEGAAGSGSSSGTAGLGGGAAAASLAGSAPLQFADVLVSEVAGGS
jgi:hypothetical protein